MGRLALLDCLLFFLGLQALLTKQFVPTKSLRIGVQAEENGFVDQGVLLLRPGALLHLGISGADHGLDFCAVDEASNIRVADLGSGENVILLMKRSLVKGSEDLVKKRKSTLSPDDEAAKVTTRSKLEQVQSPDVDKFDTRQVAECLNDAVVLVIHDKGTTALTVAAVAQLALSGAEFTGVGDLDDIRVSVYALQEGNSLLGFLKRLGGRGDYERDLGDFLDAVSTSEDERRKGRSSESGNRSEAALVLVYLDMPPAPGFGGGEHATTTAHVSEGSLARAVGSSSTDARDTGDGTTSTPRFSRSLVASFFTDGVSLTLVLRHALVHLGDYIEPDGGGQNRWER